MRELSLLFAVFFLLTPACVPLPSPYADARVNEGGPDANVVVDAGLDARIKDSGSNAPIDTGVSPAPDASRGACGTGSFDCGGISPSPSQRLVPGTQCCCEWELSPNGSGGCG